MTDPVPYAKAEPRAGWFARRRTGSGTRMAASAILALAAVALRYLTTTVLGNSDLLDGGKYVLVASVIGFAFEYLLSFIG
jgi:hypothetical protein